MPAAGRWGRAAGISPTPAAAGCGGTHFGWPALRTERRLAEKIFFHPNAERKHLLISPLHCQVILLWQVAPGLLKSQAAQVASSTIADG